MSEPLIQLKGIERRYQSGEQEVTVLHPLDLTIEAGEMIAIVGASGSGKSTLMNLLGCLDRPSAGQYLFRGQDTATLDALSLSTSGAAVCYEERKASTETFAPLVVSLWKDEKRRRAMAEEMRRTARPESGREIAEAVIALATREQVDLVVAELVEAAVGHALRGGAGVTAHHLAQGQEPLRGPPPPR